MKANITAFFVSLRLLGVFAVTLTLLTACKRDDMADQPRINPLRASDFYADGSSARMPPEHTIAIDAPLNPDPTSWLAPSTATAFPFPIGRNDLLRGQQQFMVYCTPCHGLLGDGGGMVPERGFARPPSFHIDRLRNATPTYYYNVMTLGIGAMYPYGDRVSPGDRWRIAAYIRALQISHAASDPAPPISPVAPAAKAGGGP